MIISRNFEETVRSGVPFQGEKSQNSVNPDHSPGNENSSAYSMTDFAACLEAGPGQCGSEDIDAPAGGEMDRERQSRGESDTSSDKHSLFLKRPMWEPQTITPAIPLVRVPFLEKNTGIEIANAETGQDELQEALHTPDKSEEDDDAIVAEALRWPTFHEPLPGLNDGSSAPSEELQQQGMPAKFRLSMTEPAADSLPQKSATAAASAATADLVRLATSQGAAGNRFRMQAMSNPPLAPANSLVSPSRGIGSHHNPANGIEIASSIIARQELEQSESAAPSSSSSGYPSRENTVLAKSAEEAVESSDSSTVPDAPRVEIIGRESHLMPLQRPAPAVQIGAAVASQVKQFNETALLSPVAVTPEQGPVVKILNIKLEPHGLGVVKVRMSLSGGSLALHLKVQGEDLARRVREDVDLLTNMLNSSGLALDGVVVQSLDLVKANTRQGDLPADTLPQNFSSNADARHPSGSSDSGRRSSGGGGAPGEPQGRLQGLREGGSESGTREAKLVGAIYI